MPNVIADNIERLCGIEMRFAPVESGGLPRGTTGTLITAAGRAAGAPMCLLAARALIDRVGPGDRVFVLCGSGSPPFLPAGETDGPLGGAVIVRALDLGLQAKPVVISESHLMPANRAAVAAAGVAIHEEELFQMRPHAALTIEFPYGMETGDEIERLLDHHQPSAVVFVERTGPNREGVYHSITGTPKNPDDVVANHLFASMASERGILTIGVGDGGNEVGFGNIYEEARAIQPDPVAITVTRTDILVAAAISNWGAYAIAAMLAFLLKQPALIQDPEMERRMLEAAVMAGASDGAFTNPTMYVDGTSLTTQQALVMMLAEIVNNGLTELQRAF